MNCSLIGIEQGWAKYCLQAICGPPIDPIQPGDLEEGRLRPMLLCSTTAGARPGTVRVFCSPHTIFIPPPPLPSFLLAPQLHSPGTVVTSNQAHMGRVTIQRTELPFHPPTCCLVLLGSESMPAVVRAQPGATIPNFLGAVRQQQLITVGRQDSYSAYCIAPYSQAGPAAGDHGARTVPRQQKTGWEGGKNRCWKGEREG